MPRTIALFGGSFNPPALHHRIIAEQLSEAFDEVLVVPCGPRPDKATTNDVEPIHRATMVDLAFRGLPKVRVELFDLELSTFTLTDKLEEKYRHEGEVWHVVGTDLIQGGKEGRSFIHRVWSGGPRLWETLNFAVVVRGGYLHDSADLPPKRRVFEVGRKGSSGLIREHVFRHERIDGTVTPEVGHYIERYGLYRGMLPARSTRFSLGEPKLLLELDERNPKAVELAERFQPLAGNPPNLILVIGGDGTMLRAIRSHWRLRLPFFGINAGHRGFLLNADRSLFDGQFPTDGLILHHSPLLYVETRGTGSEWKQSVAFTDAWVERACGQTAWIDVSVNGQVRLAKMVADGVLLSTAAGSTAYARSMGATPLHVETPAVVLVGSNVMEPPNWKSALLSLDSRVEFVSLDSRKRPLNGYVDGELQGEVEQMKARVSRIAAVELAFSPGHDMAEKLAQLQFPQGCGSP
ncbi:MAG: NAD(+)/NADH kinase [Planctomycetes bacterium]|nr:NAD(+)/NADH kinase [Planctomycetota bacterium]